MNTKATLMKEYENYVTSRRKYQNEKFKTPKLTTILVQTRGSVINVLEVI